MFGEVSSDSLSLSSPQDFRDPIARQNSKKFIPMDGWEDQLLNLRVS